MHRPNLVPRVHRRPLSVVIHDLHVARPFRGPAEADAPPGVDPNTVPTGAVAPQRLQPVTRQDRKLADRLRTVEKCQVACSLIGESLG